MSPLKVTFKVFVTESNKEEGITDQENVFIYSELALLGLSLQVKQKLQK